MARCVLLERAAGAGGVVHVASLDATRGPVVYARRRLFGPYRDPLAQHVVRGSDLSPTRTDPALAPSDHGRRALCRQPAVCALLPAQLAFPVCPGHPDLSSPHRCASLCGRRRALWAGAVELWPLCGCRMCGWGGLYADAQAGSAPWRGTRRAQPSVCLVALDGLAAAKRDRSPELASCGMVWCGARRDVLGRSARGVLCRPLDGVLCPVQAGRPMARSGRARRAGAGA